jgi:hypothetical protein
MAEDRRDPTDEVPEADLLEQRAAVSPAEGDDADDVVSLVSSAETDVNPADRQEQLTPVGGDDEDYPHA